VTGIYLYSIHQETFLPIHFSIGSHFIRLCLFGKSDVDRKLVGKFFSLSFLLTNSRRFGLCTCIGVDFTRTLLVISSRLELKYLTLTAHTNHILGFPFIHSPLLIAGCFRLFPDSKHPKEQQEKNKVNCLLTFSLGNLPEFEPFREPCRYKVLSFIRFQVKVYSFEGSGVRGFRGSRWEFFS
jgi:hypothetical protein